VLELVGELSSLLVPADVLAPDQLRKARDTVDKLISDDRFPDPQMLAVVAGSDAKLFDRLLDKALSTRDAEKRERWLHLLGAFPPEFAERTAALAVERAELPIDAIWSALEHYFERPVSRVIAWHALHARLDTFMKHGSHRGTDMIDATGWLCDQASRDEVAKAFQPYLTRIPGGRSHLERALAAIDHCIARRARVGDLAAAIATSR
ncbi:MAG TPA: hypothetical protein VIV40_20240, partial [Kofleriaceae bacterium]